MRERGLLQRSEEVAQALRESAQYKPPAKVVYDV
jgi:hypothetical protein